MPLPIAHGLAGYAIYELAPLPIFEKPWKSYVLVSALAIAPDVDYLPGFLLGNPNLYHHGAVHSLGAALLVGGLGAALLWRPGRFWAYFGLIAGAYYSHLVLDYFVIDTRAPFGVMLFWPLTGRYFLSPVPLFSWVEKTSDSTTFFAAFFSRHNVFAAVRELVIMGPIALLATSVQRRRRKRSQRTA